MGRGAIVGVDVGAVRIGVARSDADRALAFPVETVRRSAWGADIDRVAQIVEDTQATLVVVGLPRHMNGAIGETARAAIEWASRLAREVDVPVRLLDERLTSVSAHRDLRESGRKTRDHRAVIDQQAAVIMVEHALAIERRTGVPAGVDVASMSMREQEGKGQ